MARKGNPPPPTGAEGAGPNRDDLVRERYHELITAALNAGGRGLVVSDVQHLYPGSASQPHDFKKDCEKLVVAYTRLVDKLLAPFALPLPAIRFHDQTRSLHLSFGQRPYLKAVGRRPSPPTALCRHVLDAHWPGQPDRPLMPAGDGPIFIGFGTTMSTLVSVLLAGPAERYTRLSVCTTNLEAAAELYYSHAPVAHIRLGTQLDVDRTEGAVMPAANTEGGVDTAFVSCSGLTEKGFYTNAAPHLHRLTDEYLRNAGRIVVVMDKGKVGRVAAKSFPLRLPCDTVPTVLVSDADEAQVRPLLDPVVQYLRAPG